MTYRSLLVAVDEGPASNSRVELACDLAAAFDAHLTGLGAEAVSPPLYDPLAGGAMVGELMTLYHDMARADVERARKGFLDIVARREVRADWRGQVGYPGELCIRASRAADLVVVGARNPRSPYHAPDAADVLMGCGRPVLATPPERRREPLGAPALVAWKDCREARLALAGALPLLQRSGAVTLFAIRADDDREAAAAELDEVARHLARHGVAAEPVVAAPVDAPAGQQILAEAEAREAGLIVAGGYGHARLREWALGGVTRDLLAESPVCLCLAH
jgi:nucleotide-binding universal stress UspA family protein